MVVSAAGSSKLPEYVAAKHLRADDGNTQRLNYGRMRNPPPSRLLRTRRRISALQDDGVLLPHALQAPGHTSLVHSSIASPTVSLFLYFRFSVSFSSLCASRVSLTTSHRAAADVSGNVTRTQTGGRTGHTCTHTHSTPASRADQSLHTLCSLASSSRAFSPNGEPALNCGFSPTPTYTFVSFQPLPSPNSCSWVAAVGSNL